MFFKVKEGSKLCYFVCITFFVSVYSCSFILFSLTCLVIYFKGSRLFINDLKTSHKGFDTGDFCFVYVYCFAFNKFFFFFMERMYILRFEIKFNRLEINK